jgi:hypothetical protein
MRARNAKDERRSQRAVRPSHAEQTDRLPAVPLLTDCRRFFFSDFRLGATMEVGRFDAATRPIHGRRHHFPFALRVMGKTSMRLLDLTMSFVVAAYFLKYVDSRCVLNASALA